MKRYAALIAALTLSLLCLLAPMHAGAAEENKFYFDKTVRTFFEGESFTPPLIRQGDCREDGELTFSSSRPDNASVDEYGNLYGASKGSAVITATLKTEKRTWKCTIEVTVIRAVESVEVKESNLALYESTDAEVAELLQPVDLLFEHGQQEASAVPEAGVSPVVDAETYAHLPVLLLRMGKSQSMQATLYPDDADNRKYVLTTDNSAIVRVDGTYFVPKSVGECLVTVQSRQNPEVYKAYRALVVQPVTGLKLSSASGSKSLYVDETLQLVPTYSPANASIQAVTWSSSKESVATVDEYGVVYGVSRGEASIKATAADGSGRYATYTVTVRQQPTDISLNKTALTINAGSYQTLTATVAPSNVNDKSVVWYSSDERIAKVNSSGRVTGVGAGTCVITCASANFANVYANAIVTVQQPVTKVTFTESSLVMGVGDATSLYWNVEPADATNPAVTLSSNNSKVAVVDEYGNVQAIARGEATITVTAADGSNKKDTIKITVVQAPTAIELNTASLTVNAGAYQTLKATILPSNANDKSVVWYSSDERIAKVNSSGRVTGVSAGTCVVTCASKNFPNVFVNALVTVQQPVTKVAFTEKSVTVGAGDSANVYWTVSPADATNPAVTLSSSNTRVATVDQYGTVYGLSRGEATITATAADGSKKKGTIKVTVTQPVTGVYMKNDTLTVGVNESITATAVLEPSDASIATMTWYSDDESIATVRGSNTRPTITGKRWGATTITGVTADGGYTTHATVNVGDYDKALVITDLYLLGDEIKISVENQSNMNITKFYFTIEVYDLYGRPLPCNSNGSHIFDGSYGYTLYEGDMTRHGRFYFSNFVQPQGVGRVVMYLTGYRTDDGYSRDIRESRQVLVEYKSPNYGQESNEPAPQVTPELLGEVR